MDDHAVRALRLDRAAWERFPSGLQAALRRVLRLAEHDVPSDAQLAQLARRKRLILGATQASPPLGLGRGPHPGDATQFALDALVYFPHVERLDWAQRAWREQSLAPIGAHPQLESFSLHLCGDTDHEVVELAPLSSSPTSSRALRHLWLSSVPVSGLEPLSALGQLESLALSGHDRHPVFARPTSLSTIAGLSQLRMLSLAGKLGPLTFEPEVLASFHELVELALVPDDVSIVDLSPLRSLRQLRRLRIPGTAISTLAPLWDLLLDELSLPPTIGADEVERYRRDHPQCLVSTAT